MKFTIDRCLYSYPSANATDVSTACGESCDGPSSAMQIALTDRLLQTNSTLQYQYCDDLGAAFSKNVGACATCLESVPSSQTLVSCKEKGYTTKSLTRYLTPIQICMPWMQLANNARRLVETQVSNWILSCSRLSQIHRQRQQLRHRQQSRHR